MVHDEPPPSYEPDEIPTRVEMAQIARVLLRERAEDDPQLAMKMRELGISLGRRKPQ